MLQKKLENFYLLKEFLSTFWCSFSSINLEYNYQSVYIPTVILLKMVEQF